MKKVNLFIANGNEEKLGEVLRKFNKITHLNVNLYSDALNKSLKGLPLLQNLVHLGIYSNLYQKDKQFIIALKQLAKRCPKLKSLEFDFKIEVKIKLDLKQKLSPLKAFPSLKRLDINLPVLSNESKTEEFSFEVFDGLSNITHLSLKFNGKEINASILKDIDIYLPKLQYLEIKSCFKAYNSEAQQMADSLSRISSLQTIDLWIKSDLIYETIKTKLIEKCPKIRKFKISSINWSEFFLRYRNFC